MQSWLFLIESPHSYQLLQTGYPLKGEPLHSVGLHDDILLLHLFLLALLYSLSVFSLAKSLHLHVFLEISTTYRLVSYLWVVHKMHDFQWQYQFRFLVMVCWSLFSSKQCMIKQWQYQFRFLVMVCWSLFSSKQCMIKQLLNSAFVIS